MNEAHLCNNRELNENIYQITKVFQTTEKLHLSIPDDYIFQK